MRGAGWSSSSAAAEAKAFLPTPGAGTVVSGGACPTQAPGVARWASWPTMRRAIASCSSAGGAATPTETSPTPGNGTAPVGLGSAADALAGHVDGVWSVAFFPTVSGWPLPVRKEPSTCTGCDLDRFPLYLVDFLGDAPPGARHADREAASLAQDAPRRDVAAEQAYQSSRHMEAEPRASDAACGRLIHLPERVEDARQMLLRDPDA